MKKKIMKIAIPALAVLTLLYSCEPFHNCLRGNGKRITENRQMAASFDGIELDHPQGL